MVKGRKRIRGSMGRGRGSDWLSVMLNKEQEEQEKEDSFEFKLMKRKLWFDSALPLSRCASDEKLLK
ncbi:hypothetical protein YC2023_051463 [Brassica napus]